MRSRLTPLAGSAVAAVLLGGCGMFAVGASDTMAPLPPPQAGVRITQVTLPMATAAPASTLAPGATLPADDSDATSVASRFLIAATTSDSASAGALVDGGSTADPFTWTVDTYGATVEVAGATAWGSPSCTAVGPTAEACTWLQNDSNVALLLVDVDGTWKVSHPLLLPPDASPAGEACIAGNDPVNIRGGPSTSWPRFTTVSPGSCGITIFDVTAEDAEGTWRHIEVDGRRGWVIERVLA